MIDLALSDAHMFEVAGPTPWRFPAPKQGLVRRWALFALLLGIGLPDCCLNGGHAFGSGMEALGTICRAAR